MDPADDRKFSSEETVDRIICLTEGITKFWSNSFGWSPNSTTDLLTKSRLDWQVSLSKQLVLFLDKSNTESGLLILAWTTLGSLIEGVLKLFLTVYYEDYQIQNLNKDLVVLKNKKENIIDPGTLVLDKLRIFFEKNVFPKNAKVYWKNKGEIDWLDWIFKIQQRRNAIHAFKHREIGNLEEFHIELQKYLIFLRKINKSLPYPDEIFRPTEIKTEYLIDETSDLALADYKPATAEL